MPGARAQITLLPHVPPLLRIVVVLVIGCPIIGFVWWRLRGMTDDELRDFHRGRARTQRWLVPLAATVWLIVLAVKGNL